MRAMVCLALCIAVAGCAAPAPRPLIAYDVSGDAVPASLTAQSGDPLRGRAVLAGRDANCLLCHDVPGAGARFVGNLAPPLAGVGARLDPGQLRLRIIDASLLNRDTIMPAYYRVSDLNQVAEAYRGKSILSAQQVEDVVAYLLSLR